MVEKTIIEKSRNAAKYTLIFKTGNQILGGIAIILIVRALSEEEYGVYNLLYSLISLIGVVLSLGLNNVLHRYIPEYYQRGEFIIAHNLYRAVSFIRLVSNIFLLGLVLLLWDDISPLLKLSNYKPYFMLFSVVILIVMQRTLISICLSSYFLQKYYKSIVCISPFIRILGYGYMILYKQDIWYAILTDLIAHLIVFLWLQIIYFRKIPTSQGTIEHLDTAEKERLFQYAFFYNFNEAGSEILSSTTDYFIIAMYMDQFAVGAYSFCVTMTVLIGELLPLRYFIEIIRPALFSTSSSGPTINTTLFFQNCLKVSLIFSIPIFMFLMVSGPDAIAVFFGGKFIEYAPVLCTIFFFFEILSFPTDLIAQLREKANILFYSKIFALYNLIADVILIKYFGIWGAVFATGTATFGKELFIWFFVRKEASFSGMGSFCKKIIIYWAGAAIIIFGATIWIPDPMTRFSFSLLLFSPAFLLQFRCDYFNDHEKKIWFHFSKDVPGLITILKHFKMIPEY